MTPANLQKLLHAKHILYYWTVQRQSYNSKFFLGGRALAIKEAFGHENLWSLKF